MNQSKKALARAAVEAAIMLLVDDSSDSSDSDDDVEILVMKMYLKYKAKRRKLFTGNPSSFVDANESKSNRPTNIEEPDFDGKVSRPSPEHRPTEEEDTSLITGAVRSDSNIELVVLEETSAADGSQTSAICTSTNTPFQLHVSNIFSFIPASLALRILTDQDFKIHFKLSRSAVENLVRAIKNTRAAGRTGRPMMPPEKSILVFLWFLSTRESYTSVSERFDIPKSVTYSAFAHTCLSVAALKEHHIQWPTGDAALKVIQEFETADPSCWFPGVVGCLGATHIPISEPKDANFLNSAEYNSIILQVVCDATGAFIDVFTGWPGSASNACVWLYSPLYGELKANADFLPSGSHLLAGDAYPLSQHLMVPFRNAQSPAEVHFNEAVHAKKAILDRAFARLKHRFERLGYLHVHIVENIKYITLAACVCHNIAVREADEWSFEEEEEEGEDDGLNVPQPADNVEEDEAAVDAKALETRLRLAEGMFASLGEAEANGLQS